MVNFVEFMNFSHEYFMKMALQEAEEAAKDLNKKFLLVV